MIPDTQVLGHRIYVNPITIPVENELKNVAVPGTCPGNLTTHHVGSLCFPCESTQDQKESNPNHIVYNVENAVLVYIALLLSGKNYTHSFNRNAYAVACATAALNKRAPSR